MRTVIRRNNWREFSESEIERAMPWMKITHRHRMNQAFCLMFVFGIPAVVFPVMHIVNNTLTESFKHFWIYIIAGFFVFLGAYCVVDYTRKMKCFAKGEFKDKFSIKIFCGLKVFSSKFACGVKFKSSLGRYIFAKLSAFL